MSSALLGAYLVIDFVQNRNSYIQACCLSRHISGPLVMYLDPYLVLYLAIDLVTYHGSYLVTYLAVNLVT